jgi:hypothetical protein
MQANNVAIAGSAPDHETSTVKNAPISATWKCVGGKGCDTLMSSFIKLGASKVFTYLVTLF